MVGAFSSNARRPSSGSWLDKWLRARRRHPSEFDCGVRVVEGDVPGERARWSYRRSGVDPLIVAGVVRLRHGADTALALRVDPEVSTGVSPGRPDHVLLTAVETSTGARLELSVPVGETERFGVVV